MSPWEAVEFRLGMNEEAFREMHEEERELVAFWLYGEDSGPYCVAGVDPASTGGTTEIERLNLAFMEAVLRRVAADDLLPVEAGPFEHSLDVILTELEDSESLERGDDGRVHPTADFAPSAFAEKLEEKWHVQTLRQLLNWVYTGSQALSVMEFEGEGGGGCSSNFAEVFVWVDNKQHAAIHVEAQIAEARRVLALWTKDMTQGSG